VYGNNATAFIVVRMRVPVLFVAVRGATSPSTCGRATVTVAIRSIPIPVSVFIYPVFFALTVSMLFGTNRLRRFIIDAVNVIPNPKMGMHNPPLHRYFIKKNKTGRI